MEIKVVMEDDSDATTVVLDSDELGFKLHDLQVGENRSVVDSEGRSVLITRQDEGFTLEVDGKTIELPPPPHGKRGMMHGPGDGEHATVRIIRDASPGVMIIGGEEIDEATQEIIRSALAAAGHEEVHFAGGHDGGPHQVHVIREEVEVTQ